MLQGLGVAGLVTPLQGVVDVVLIVQSLWFIAAGLAVGATTLRPSAAAAQANAG